MLRASQRGLAEIAAHEAIVLSAYIDSAGVWTVGIGHTANAGHPDPAKERREFSMDEIMSIFARDIEKCEDRVRKAFKRPLSQEQFDAAVSFDFNTGGIHRASWVKHFNQGDDARARTAFMAWRKPKAIIPRRQKERALFFDGTYSGDGRVCVYPASRSGTVLWRKGKRIALPTNIDLTPADPEDDIPIEELIANPEYSVLPRHRPQASDAEIRQLLQNAHHLLPADRRNDAVYMIGVDDYYSEMAQRNVYDSAIFLVTPDDVTNYNANCDPSRQRKGVAQLKANQAVLYAPGPHGFQRKGGPYPAFRQKGECTVIRDGQGADTGIFWINIHRGGLRTTSSAGCQTIPPHQWAEFKTDGYRALDEAGQKDFYYLLLPHRAFLEAAAQVTKSSQSKPNAGAAAGVAVIATGGLIAAWWDQITTWIGGFFS